MAVKILIKDKLNVMVSFIATLHVEASQFSYESFPDLFGWSQVGKQLIQILSTHLFGLIDVEPDLLFQLMPVLGHQLIYQDRKYIEDDALL